MVEHGRLTDALRGGVAYITFSAFVIVELDEVPEYCILCTLYGFEIE